MSTDLGSRPAYPVAQTWNDVQHCWEEPPTIGGLTKRELFAAMMLQGLLAGPDYDPHGPIAVAAVHHADALLAALQETQR